MKFGRHFFFSIFAGVAALLVSIHASAQVSDDECTQDILLTYYPEKFVTVTLERFEIPRSQWPSIQSELAQKDKQVVPRVEEKAAKMTPNPLRDPQQRQQAVMIFRETLYELFADVMQSHGINDREQIQKMLDDIQHQKAKQFAQCVEKFQSGAKETPRQGVSRQPRGPSVEYRQ